MKMRLNFGKMIGTRLRVTHHGFGPTCIHIPYLFTRIGEELQSTPFLVYHASFHCFAEDKEVREFDLFYWRKQHEAKGFDDEDIVLCFREGGAQRC